MKIMGRKKRAKKTTNTRRRGERGQSATEYMLLISVIVIGTVSLAWGFSDGFKQGVGELGQDVKEFLDHGCTVAMKDAGMCRKGP